MDLLLGPDEELVVGTVREFARRHLPRERLREWESAPDAIDRSAWLAGAEIGLLGLGIPDSAGGVGLGLVEEALAFRELGRHGAPGPLVATVLAAHLAVGAGETDLLESILKGECQVGLVVPLPGCRVEDGQLDGPAYLLDATAAELVLLTSPDRSVLLGKWDLRDVETEVSLDPGTRVESATAVQTPAIASAPGPALFDRGTLLVAAFLTGIAEELCERTVAYCKTREQFGRPIGAHQAVKHACADMAMHAEASRSQLLYAAAAFRAGHGDVAYQASVARVIAARAASDNARMAIQLHGGIGYTWEHDLHLAAKRAAVLALQLGSRELHLSRVLEMEDA